MSYGTITEKEVEILKKIQDKEQIEYWLEKGNIRGYFDTPDLIFQLFCYEKGEYITVPGKRMDNILFMVEGTARIYGVRKDGILSTVNQIESPAVLGDLEYPDRGAAPFYTEAKTQVTCLSLSTKIYRGQLDRDLRFLHMLLQSYADKFFFPLADTMITTLEERVLFYMKNICPQCEINGIETAVFQLRCSRRQLQRVLKKLCDSGEVEKIGKGRYRLVI